MVRIPSKKHAAFVTVLERSPPIKGANETETLTQFSRGVAYEI